MTIVGRLLGVEVTAGLEGLHFGEIEEGKVMALMALSGCLLYLWWSSSCLRLFWCCWFSFYFSIFVYKCNNCISYAALVLFVVLMSLFLVLNNNDGLPIVRAHSLFVRFRSWRFVGPPRLVAIHGVWWSLRSEVVAPN